MSDSASTGTPLPSRTREGVPWKPTSQVSVRLEQRCGPAIAKDQICALPHKYSHMHFFQAPDAIWDRIAVLDTGQIGYAFAMRYGPTTPIRMGRCAIFPARPLLSREKGPHLLCLANQHPQIFRLFTIALAVGHYQLRIGNLLLS